MHRLLLLGIYFLTNENAMFVGGQLGSHVVHCPLNCTCIPAIGSVMCEKTHRFHIPSKLPNGTVLLALPKNEFTSLSSTTFNKLSYNTTLESLILYDNKISYIDPFTFQNMRNLKKLWLFGNRLKRLQENGFSGLRNLTELYLSQNLLTIIDGNAFADLQNLELLQLWGNQLVNLNSESFMGLDNLSNLTLGDNKFIEIPSLAFEHLPNLVTLEILNLPVTSIRANAFTSLTKLEKLHIGDWPLQSIDDKGFKNLISLKHLSLNHCNLQSVPYKALASLPSLKKLLLSNNTNIKSLGANDFSTLRQLEELYLSNISLHTIHESPFQLLSKLKVLDLSQNQISTLPSHLFLQLENLRVLNLSHNHLEVLHPLSFNNLEIIDTIDLSNNNLICDCEIEWLKTFQEMKIRQQFTLLGKCSDPYKGTPVAALAPQKFICEKPGFSEEDKKRHIKGTLGKRASLPCKPSQGVPTPKVNWTKVNNRLSEHYQMLKNGTLFIEKVEENDGGKYLCDVSNKLGKATSVITFEIVHKPAPNDAKAQSSTAVAVSLAIVFVIVLLVVFMCRKKCSKFFKNRSYEPMNSYDDARFLMKNGPKLS